MKAETISFTEGTPAAIRVLKIKDYAPHWHDQVLEIVYVLRGSVNLITSFENFTIDAGEFVLINQSEIHHIHGEADNAVVLIYFDLSCFKEINKYVGYLYFSWESFNLGSNQKEAAVELKKLLLSLIIEYGKKEAAASGQGLIDSVTQGAEGREREPREIGDVPDSGQISQLAQKIILLLIGSFDIVHYYNDRDITTDQLHRYHGIIRYIEQNYSRKITMEELAKREHLGKNYVSQFWKKIMDLNFTEFVNSRRVELSEKLLLTTSLSMEEISIGCGFSDPKYFYKCFKKWYRRTPLEHKKKYTELYNKRKDSYETLWLTDIASDLERVLTEYYIEEERGNNPASAPGPFNKEKEIERKIRSYSRVRIKKEIIKESQKEIDLKNIFLSLLNQRVVSREGDRNRFDWNYIDTVLDFILEMDYILCIEIDYSMREPIEWKSIMEEFAKHCKALYGKDLEESVEYWIFYEGLDKAVEIRTLIKELSSQIEPQKIKVSIRF